MSLRSATAFAEQAGWQLRRAIPRGPGHLLLDLGAADGTTIAGQWFDDRDRAAHVAEGTTVTRSAGGGADCQVRLIGGRLLLQPGGYDRRLPALRQLLGRPGAALVAHRPERRGVVRHPAVPGHAASPGNGPDDDLVDLDEQYSKVVRPDRLAAVVAGLDGARATGLCTPWVVRTDPAAGVVTTRALPGRTLHAMLGGAVDGSAPGSWFQVGTAVGASIGQLHRGQLPEGASLHDAAAELAVSRRWIALAAAHGVLLPSDRVIESAMGRAERNLGLSRSPMVVPVHRDLHDKQILLTGLGDPGVLDLDLLAAGDPALDLANLLVHLELRVRQGVTTRGCATSCAAGLLAGYRSQTAGRELAEDPASVFRRVPGYSWATRARLAAVYAFRPPSAAAARLLVTDPRPLVAEVR